MIRPMKSLRPASLTTAAFAALLITGCSTSAENARLTLEAARVELQTAKEVQAEATAAHEEMSEQYADYNDPFDAVLNPQESRIDGQVPAKTARGILEEQNYLLSGIQVSERD